jgi:hypothetical protein
MRVPSIGLPLDERRIVREGYRLAERMLRDYQDPPAGPIPVIQHWLAGCRRLLRDLNRSPERD